MSERLQSSDRGKRNVTEIGRAAIFMRDNYALAARPGRRGGVRGKGGGGPLHRGNYGSAFVSSSGKTTM